MSWLTAGLFDTDISLALALSFPMHILFDDYDAVSAVLQRNFTGYQLLVAGDLMLDRYLWGEVGRISPEAPVPVVRLLRQSENPGGAANVALNLRGLGLLVTIVGLVGTDAEGTRLTALLAADGIDTSGVVSFPERPTSCKTRVIGEHQQMLRIDVEDISPLATEITAALTERLQSLLAQKPAALILSDYGKGVLAPILCQATIAAGRAVGIPVLVDPKGRDYTRYRGATLLSPNRAELALATGVPSRDLDALLAAGERLRAELELRYLLVTLGDQGMTLLDGAAPIHIPAVAQEVYDVSGAGDTVIATTAAGLVAGLPIQDALRLANLAAGVVIGKVGTTPIAAAELAAALFNDHARFQSEKVCTLPTLLAQIAHWRTRGERIVFTNGCFDLLHAGHVTYLERARHAGHRLIVGLNTDRSVRALKGETRPVIHEDDRARVLAALAVVDAVILFDDDTPLTLIRAIRPDVLAKGADYREDQVVGASEVKSQGGCIYLVPLAEGHSSSNIMKRIRAVDDRQ
ncbi:D-beta-D-heptose 7-phosphate kinase / D-beta-D-heptose 1-phosphate adenylyltransferase [Gammaproteobacteria bacterium]